MNMEIRSVKENSDGSADYVFDMSDEEKDMLLRLGIITAIKNGIKEGKKYAAAQDSVSTGSTVVQDNPNQEAAQG
jgi:hypothetical protein